MYRAQQINFGSLSSYLLGEESYNQDKLGLGPLMIQQTGTGAEDKWTGPLPVGLGRPFEQIGTHGYNMPWAMQWSNTATSKIDWIFIPNAGNTASAFCRIAMYTYNRLTATLAYVGYVQMTLQTGTHTVRAFRMAYEKYSTGSASVSGTAVTGTSTAWQTARMCVGCRIGFGSTDPTAITNWYEISAIGSETGITLTGSAGTIADGPYVIEDLRGVVVTTCNTATNGGLYLVKGIQYGNFSNNTTAAAAVATDNVRAVYWLKSATTITETVGNGMGLLPRTDWQTHYVFIGSGTTTQRLFKFNIRKNLTLSSGADTTAYTLKSGASASLTGTMTQVNNGRVANIGHGPGAGVNCYYFTTSTRVYRTKDVTTITDADANWIAADNMIEVPPGTTTTFAASGSMVACEYASSLDKWLITTSTASYPFKDYLTAYYTGGESLDRMFGSDLRQSNSTTADNTVANVPSFYLGAFYTAWIENGLAYLANAGAGAANTSVLYIVPLGADWEYISTTGCRIITPRIATPNASRYISVCVGHLSQIVGSGGKTSSNLGISTEAFRIRYRTTDIDTDATSGWNLLDQTGAINATGASYIQFALEFRTIGHLMVPARITGLTVVWDELSTDSHFQLSVDKSSVANKRFTWRHFQAFGTTVPALRVVITDADGAGTLVDDNTTSPTGTWERSTNGTDFVAWTNADLTGGNQTTYVRYTPASLADNIRVTAALVLN